MDQLNKLLDRKNLDLKQKTAEANERARRYHELNAQLEKTKKQLSIYRELAAENPLAYRPELASILNSLGVLYR